jgi:hypothetical protein
MARGNSYVQILFTICYLCIIIEYLGFVDKGTANIDTEMFDASKKNDVSSQIYNMS